VLSGHIRLRGNEDSPRMETRASLRGWGPHSFAAGKGTAEAVPFFQDVEFSIAGQLAGANVSD
jgi:hypothetical protein